MKRKQFEQPIEHVSRHVLRKVEQYFFPYAASYGDVDLLKYLIDSGDDVNEVDSDGATALHLAINSKKSSNVISQTIGMLLEAGASLDQRNNEGHTPLHVAVKCGHLESIEQLIKAGADVNAETDPKAFTSLHVAINSDLRNHDQSEVIRLLIESGASLEKEDDRGFNPLQNAVELGKINVVKQLLLFGANVNAANPSGKTCLLIAAKASKSNQHGTQIIQILLEAGAMPNTSDSQGLTPLHAVAASGRAIRVEMLIGAGANVNAVNNIGVTPLEVAISSRDVSDNDRFEVVFSLLKAHASLSHRNNHGLDALQVAVGQGRVTTVEQLIKAGADVHSIVEQTGESCLHLVTKCKTNDDDCATIVQLLLEAGVSLDIQSCNGLTVLHVAAFYGEPKIVKLLIKAGANVNAITNARLTCLQSAISSPNIPTNHRSQVILSLLRAGASLSHRNIQGYDALQMAVNLARLSTVKQLIQAGADVHSTVAITNESCLHLAAKSRGRKSDCLGIIQLLLEAGAPLEVRDFLGVTPLRAAAFYGKATIVEKLIKCGADVNSIANNGLTCLESAIFSSKMSDDERFEVVFSLTKAKASLNHRDKNGFDALLMAVNLGRVTTVEQLIKAGANVHTTLERTGESCLHLVIKSTIRNDHRLSIVRLLLNSGASVDAIDLEKQTPLIRAVRAYNVDVVQHLIEAGADVNAVDSEGRTILHDLIRSFPRNELRAKIINVLLNATGVYLNIRDRSRWSPFEYAVLCGDALVVDQFIAAGADIHAVDSEGNTCLHILVRSKEDPVSCAAVLGVLLGAGASLEARNKTGLTPLHSALLLGAVSWIERFIEAGADVNAKDKNGQTGLLLISGSNMNDDKSSEIVRLLLKAGASTDCPSNNGLFPLDAAAVIGKVRTVRQLIEFNANVQVGNKGITSLHLTSAVKNFQNEHVEIIRLLLKAGASLDSRCEFNCLTPLHFAVESCGVKQVEFLIGLGADVNAINSKNMTSLHLALCLNRQEAVSHQIIQLLLKAGASLDVRDKEGKTALMYAARFGDVNLIEQMIESGADAKVITFQNQSSLHFAISNEVNNDSPRLVSILLQAGAPVNAHDRMNRHTPLHKAVMAGDVKVVERLIRAGADVDAVDHDGKTCLHLIFCSSRIDDQTHGVVRLLLKSGAKLELRDKNGKTPLVHAVTYGDAKLIEHLIAGGADASIFALDLSILHHAIRSPKFINECLDVIPLLLEAGASLESRDRRGRTSLILAAVCGCVNLVEKLIDAGADVNATDLADRTVLHYIMDENLSPISEEIKRKIMCLLIAAGAEKHSAAGRELRMRSKGNIQKFYQDCKDELWLMQTSIAHGSTTFYHILKKMKVFSYVRNEYVIEGFERNEYADLFPILGNALKKSFVATQVRKNLIDEASQGLFHILGFDNALIHDRILQNLSDKDLQNLCNI